MSKKWFSPSEKMPIKDRMVVICDFKGEYSLAYKDDKDNFKYYGVVYSYISKKLVERWCYVPEC